MEAWKIKSNIEAFGYYDAALICKKKKMSFEETYFAIFGKYPTK